MIFTYVDMYIALVTPDSPHFIPRPRFIPGPQSVVRSPWSTVRSPCSIFILTGMKTTTTKNLNKNNS